MQESLFDSFDDMGYTVNALNNDNKKAKLVKKPGQMSLPKQRNLFIQTMH